MISTVETIDVIELEQRFLDLDFLVEQREVLDVPWNSGDFCGGVGIGLASVGLFAAGLVLN